MQFEEEATQSLEKRRHFDLHGVDCSSAKDFEDYLGCQMRWLIVRVLEGVFQVVNLILLS